MIRLDRGDHDRRRGQFVLLSAVVVGLAVLALLTAYLQLGYAADVEASGPDGDPVRDGTRSLAAATHDAAVDIPSNFAWGERTAAVTAVRDRLAPRVLTLEGSRAAEGVAYQVSYNESAARAWARTACPGGPDRQFGDCRVDRGVVVQERAGRTHVLAVAFDLRVVTPDGETAVTVLVDPVDGVRDWPA